MIVSCALPVASQGRNTICLQGHVTLSAGGSCLVTDHFESAYLLTKSDMPMSVWEYVKAQPKHPDLRSESGFSRSAAIEVEGTVLPPDATGFVRFCSKRILQLSPASYEYSTAWSKWHLPVTIKNSLHANQ
jgi:hypothetical protein